MSRTVKNHGGVLVRLVATTAGFYAKYGYWPRSIAIGSESLASLVTHSLTPVGLFNVQSKVELVEGSSDTVLAQGAQLESFDYSEEMGTLEINMDIGYKWFELDLPG